MLVFERRYECTCWFYNDISFFAWKLICKKKKLDFQLWGWFLGLVVDLGDIVQNTKYFWIIVIGTQIFIYIKHNKYYVFLIQHKKLYPSNEDGQRSKAEKKYAAPIDTDDISHDAKPNKLK